MSSLYQHRERVHCVNQTLALQRSFCIFCCFISNCRGVWEKGWSLGRAATKDYLHCLFTQWLFSRDSSVYKMWENVGLSKAHNFYWQTCKETRNRHQNIKRELRWIFQQAFLLEYRLGRAAVLKPDGVAHLLAQHDIHLISNPLGDTHGRHPPGLGAGHRSLRPRRCPHHVHTPLRDLEDDRQVRLCLNCRDERKAGHIVLQLRIAFFRSCRENVDESHTCPHLHSRYVLA